MLPKDKGMLGNFNGMKDAPKQRNCNNKIKILKNPTEP